MSGSFWRYAVAILVIGLMLAAFVLPAFASTPPAEPNPASGHERPTASDTRVPQNGN